MAKTTKISMHFAEEVKERLIRKKPDIKVEIVKSLKNNGVTLVGISISKKEEQVIPSIYLETYYEKYLNGKPMESIVQELLCIYEKCKVESPVMEDELIGFEKVKQNIYYKLVNLEKNEELLKSLPYIPYQDLAVVFYILVSKEEAGIASIPVNKKLMRRWGMDRAEELFEIASANTQRLFAPSIQYMGRFIQELENPFEYEEAQEDEMELYIATNCSHVNGASVILYENLLQEFARKVQRDFFVLPSSIHELLFVPILEYMEPDELKGMVCEVNQLVVSEEDILSDSVYRYYADQRCLRVVA